MRKILLLLVGALISLAANADGYWVDVRGDNIGWGEGNQQYVDNPTVVTFSSLAIGTGTFKAKFYNPATDEDTWLSTGGEIEQGQWIKITTNTVNGMKIKGATEGEKFKVEVDVPKSSIRVTSLDQSQTETFTIYYNNSASNWSTVNAYIYGPEIKADWPGEAMTDIGNNIWKFTFTNDKNYEKVIFNAGNNQPQTNGAGFSLKNGQYYDYDGETDAPVISTSHTVYFDNSELNWSPVYVYLFDNNGKHGDWPGAEMTAGENGIYSYTYKDYDAAYVIFNAGYGKMQTPTEAFVDGKTYTPTVVNVDVKYNNQSTDWSTVYGYVYDGDINSKWPGLEMTKGADNVWSFSQKVPFTPSKIIFHNNDGGQNEYDFVNGKTYGEGVVGNTYTIYFDNSETSWGEVYAYVYDDTAKPTKEKAAWPGETMTQGANNVWSYTFRSDFEPKSVVFNNNDKGSQCPVKEGFTFVNGQTYGKNGKLEYTTIYFNMGNDWLTKYDTSFKPHCKVYKYGTDNNYNGNADGQEAQEMVNVKNQIWAYSVPTSKINNFDTADFYVKKKDSNEYAYYVTKKHEYGVDYDAENWTKYIYSPSDDKGVLYTRQGYMTFDQYVEFYDMPKHDEIFLAGQMIEGLDWDQVKLYNYRVENKTWYKADDGCFYIHPTVVGTGDANNPPKFKISYVDPVKYRDLNCPGRDLDNARMWTTFNLGIVGIDENHKNISDLTAQGVTVNTSNNDVTFKPRVTIPYNHFNQFDWVVDRVDLAETDFKPYIVVDSKEKTVTLILFDPDPKVNVQKGNIYTLPLEYADSKTLHSGDAHHLAACEANGHQLFDQINVASGTVTVTGAEGDAEMEDNFEVTYTVSVNGREMMKTKESGIFDVDYMALGDENSMKVRARYVNDVTKLAFRSRTGGSEVTVSADDIDAAEFEVSSSKHVITNVKNDEDKYNVHAVITGHYHAPSTNAVNFVDFEVENAPNAQLLPEENGMGVNGLKGWSKGEDQHGDASWTKNVREDKNLPICIPAVQSVNGKSDIKNTEVNVTVYTVYPFLVSPNAVVTKRPQNVMRRAEGDAPEKTLPADLENYSIINVSKPTTASVTIPGDVVTGIEDVTVDENVEAVYYTIQGIRVNGELTPGIYIRRIGDKAEKVYIR